MASVVRYFSQTENYLAKDFIAQVRKDIIDDAWGALDPCDVLDVGCGDGRISAVLLHRGHRVTFLDASPAMLALARKNASSEDERAEFIEGTLDSIPPNRRFGLVLCLGLMAHVSSVEGTLQSISELSSHDAQIAIQITDSGSVIGRMNSRYTDWRERHFRGFGYQLNELDLEELVRAAAQCQLELVRTYRYSVVLPGMIRFLPNWLLYRMSALSRRWPVSLVGGEVIALFRRKETPEAS
jgi:SAM-dependent methyltransferase